MRHLIEAKSLIAIFGSMGLARASLCCLLVGAALAAPPPPTGSTLLRGLSLHDRIAQLIVVRGYGDYPPPTNAEYRRFIHWIRDDHVGGFIVAGHIRNGNVIPAQPFEMRSEEHTSELQSQFHL